MDKRAAIEVLTTIRPQFYDLDPMNVVWHGNHVRYLEVARCALLERIGYTYEDMEASGYAWPVVDLRLRYYRTVRFRQEVDACASILEWENRLKIAYLLTDHRTGAKLARGHTVQVAVDLERQEMLWQTPPILGERLAPFLVRS